MLRWNGRFNQCKDSFLRLFKAFNRFGIDSLSRCIDTRSRGNRCVRRHIKGTRRVRRRRKSSRRRRKSPLLPISHPSSVEEHANVCKCMQIRVCGRASPPPSRHPFSSKRNPQIKEMQTIHCFHYCCHRYCYIFGWGLLSAIPPTPSPSPYSISLNYVLIYYSANWLKFIKRSLCGMFWFKTTTFFRLRP